jgi:hypothetical protein
MFYGNNEKEMPKYQRRQQQRQLEASDNITDSLNTLIVRQMQDEMKLSDINEYINTNKSGWIKSGQKQVLVTQITRRKDLEASLRRTMGQIANLEKMQQTGQQAATAVQVAQTMQEGNEMVQSLTSTVQVEDVEDILDSFQENVQDVDEIGEATSKPIMGMDFQANADIDAEIEAMELEFTEKATLDLPNIPNKDVNNNNNNNETEEINNTN